MPRPLIKISSRRRRRKIDPAGGPQPTRSPAQKGLALLTVALVVGIAGADALTIRMQRAATIANFFVAQTNLTNGMAAQTARALGAIDRALAEAQATFGGAPDQAQEQLQARLRSREAFELLQDRFKRLSGILSLSIADVEGRITSTTRAFGPGEAAGQGDVAALPFFRQLRGDGSPAVAVGDPLQDNATGIWSVRLARRINDPTGNFAGAVMAELSLDDLADFYRVAMPVHRTITLLKPDGTILLRHPALQALAGRKVPAGAPFHAASAAGGGKYAGPSYFDRTPVVAVLRALHGLPLIVETSVSETEVLAGWRGQRLWLIFGGVAACTGVILLVRLFALQLNRLAVRNSELDEARRQLDLAMSNMSQGLCFFDGKQRLRVCNRRFADIYGLSPAATRPGISLRELTDHWFAAGGPANVTRDDYLMAHATIVRAAEPHQSVIETTDGRTIAIQQQPMPDGGWVATHEDITARRRAEEKISFLAQHDVLTGLPNRSMLLERINQARPGAARGRAFALLFLDLDRFKAVNDTLGHAAGDALLQTVAARLRETVREGDTVARLGGDEFVILQANLKNPETAARLARRIIAAVGAPYTIGENEVIIGVSIGIDIAATESIPAGDMLKNADMALYISKSEGRGTFRFFEADMDAKVQNRHALERDLRCALDRGEFALHYQPIVDARSGRPCGFEALLRWNHPLRGLVGPQEFIPLAEEIGLIIPIGEWTVRQACRDAAVWPDHIHVSVNLSPIQFRSANLVAMVRDSLASSGLAAERLELEITESVLLQSNERNLAVMHEFRASDIGIVMDDFGVGYSSLSTLRQFPFQRIKIDRCFVQDLGLRSDAVCVVRAIVGLCRDLDIGTIAEGVETEEQMGILLAEGCTDMQGYLFSRPKPASLLGPMHASLLPPNAQTQKTLASV